MNSISKLIILIITATFFYSAQAELPKCPEVKKLPGTITKNIRYNYRTERHESYDGVWKEIFKYTSPNFPQKLMSYRDSFYEEGEGDATKYFAERTCTYSALKGNRILLRCAPLEISKEEYDKAEPVYVSYSKKHRDASIEKWRKMGMIVPGSFIDTRKGPSALPAAITTTE